MKFTKLSLIAALAVSAMTTSAMAGLEVSANVSATNNYVWRGMTQTNNNAAVQGGLDIGMDGLYLGAWASNVTNDTEVDGYVGYAGETDGLSYDIGAIRYGYLDASSGNFNEAYLGLGYDFGVASLGVTYSKGLDDAPDDIAADLSLPVMQGYSLDLAYGDYDTYGTRYSVGVSKSFDKVDFSVAYHNFEHDTTSASDEKNVVVSVGTSF